MDTPAGIQAGSVVLHYTLKGSSPASHVHVSYSVDGLTFRSATEGIGGDGTQDLAVDGGNLFAVDGSRSAVSLPLT